MLPDSNNVASKPEVKALISESDQLLAMASSYSVTTAEQYTDAGEQLQQVKGAMKRLDDLRMSITRPMDAAKKAVMDLFRSPEEKLQRAESGIKRAMLSYHAEQERIRREEQRRVDEEARKQREKLEAQAKKAAKSGKAEKAEQLQERAAMIVAPVIQVEQPKVTGVQTREIWKFEVEDESKLPREYLSRDDKKIAAVVRALKDQANIPGVRVYSEKNLAAGAA